MKLAIVVQGNDDYDFLWEGLFLTWKLNWNWEEFNFPLFLITETKQFSQCHPDCDFKTINVGNELKGHKNYSNKLLIALQKLKKEGYTHILSAIINIHQDKPWPLIVYDHNNNMETINMTNKDDIVLYESATIFHGRPIPFRGDSFVNLFIHFKTNDWIEVEEKIRDKFNVNEL